MHLLFEAYCKSEIVELCAVNSYKSINVLLKTFTKWQTLCVVYQTQTLTAFLNLCNFLWFHVLNCNSPDKETEVWLYLCPKDRVATLSLCL